jgi:hypothetical protein
MEQYHLEQIITELFKNILKRIPNDSDVSSLATQMRSNPVDVVAAMLDSPELISRLIGRDTNGLVAANCLSHGLTFARPESRITPKFFIHVPKTAGTSIHAHLNENSTNIWARSERSDSKPNFELWPQWIQHTPLSDTPSNVRVFSITRDPISRLISAWLFYSSNSQNLERGIEIYQPMSFTTFLKEKSARLLIRGHDFYYWPNAYEISKDAKNKKRYVQRHFGQLSGRFEFIASIEDQDSVQKLLELATNSSTLFEKRSNVTDEVSKSEPRSISNGEFLSLFESTELEYALMDHLYQSGMIGLDYCRNIEENARKMLAMKNITVQ